MKKNRAQKDIFYLTLSSLLLVVAWIGFSLYHRWTTSTITEDLQMQIVPINPTFDTETIQKLKSRTKVNPFFEVKDPTLDTSFIPSLPPSASSSAETITGTPAQEPNRIPLP